MTTASIPLKHTPKTSVSVIIPARNEAENIHDCLSDFLLQDYPFDLFEIIIADDHSTDNTGELAKKFMSQNPALHIRMLEMKNTGKGKLFKKQAITESIDMATGEFILTTDADCRRGPQWISSMVYGYESNAAEMVSAPVVFSNEKSALEKVQSLEFLGLIAIGAAAIKNNKPFLCNGANLGFGKAVFMNAGGYSGAGNIPTGDDTQLLLKIASHGKGNIYFMKSSESTVCTMPQKTINELLNQRKRWASKIPVQMNSFTIGIALTAYFLHAGLILSAIMMIYRGGLYGVMIPLAIKMIPEFILLLSVSKFFNKSRLLYLFLPAQIIYPLYISVVGVLSLSGSYNWKDRKVK